jgi:heme exporter protein A
MPQADTPVILAEGLERRFGALVALSGVDLSVSAGELVLVVGPNGAGKSTLLRILSGLATPTRGRVRVGNLDLHADPEARGAIGFLSHQTLVYDDLTARENLRFAAALHGLDGADQRVQQALDAVGLAHRADVRAGTFSRGMSQRLAIARATLHAPPVLLLDEPFTGLDSPAATALRERLAAERAGGRVLICVTHEPAEVWEIATRVVVIRGGRIVLDTPRPPDLEAFRVTYAGLLVT